MRKFLISLVLLLGSTASQAALVNYSGDFSGSFSNSATEEIFGSWSVLVDESGLGSGWDFIGDLIPTSFSFTSVPSNTPPIDSSEARVQLSFFNGAITDITVGGNGATGGPAPNTNDFHAYYLASPGGQLADLLSSVAQESTVHRATTFSGSFTATASVVPIPAAVWLFGFGLLALMGLSRRKKAT